MPENHPAHTLSLEFILCRSDVDEITPDKDEFVIGYAQSCDVVLAEDPEIAPRHCRIYTKAGGWFVEPLADAPLRLNGKPLVCAAALADRAVLTFGNDFGPGCVVRLQSVGHGLENLGAQLKDFNKVRSTLIASAARSAAEKPYQRKVLKRWFGRLSQKHRKRLLVVSSVLLVLLAGSGGTVFYQHQRLAKMQGIAEDMFYQMKDIELRMLRVDDFFAMSGDSSLLREREDLWQAYQRMAEQYDAYIREVGLGMEKMPEDERLILQTARVFGECDINVPPEFVSQVKDYINRWRTTPRYRKALERAISNGYIDYITRVMIKYHLPPQFMYLAMQESDFQPETCGPKTRFGIAKGMWQFIPGTAVHFGLKLGPLVDVPKPDPHDERHNFKKSTEAAARYLQFLYKTEAQASGLLVMASYNWGERKVLTLVNRMPDNPRERNFWNLIKKHKLPKETMDYVFYIFSAAVIGENPKLFGFDLENPLELTLNDSE